jgi:hypothetical protein
MGPLQSSPNKLHPNRKRREMKIVFAILLSAALSGSLFAQTKSTGDAKSGGPCSPAVSGDHNTFVYRYCGNDPEEAERIFRLLKAVAQGEVLTNSKLDQILEILSRPIKITKSTPFAVAAPPGAHPRTAVNFYTDDPVDRGQFEIMCDRACTPIDICTLMGSNNSKLATVSDHEVIAEFLFQRQFPALTECKLTVESRDDKPVKIIELTTSRRTTNLVLNVVQPRSVTVTGGGVDF